MYIIKSNRLIRAIKYCKRTLQCICCNQFSLVFFYLLFQSFFLLYFFQISHQLFFLAFNYTIVSKHIQLKKNHTDIFHVLFKNYYPRCYCIKLNIKDTIGKEIEKRKNKIYSLAKVSYFLKNGIIKLQNTEKLIFR